MDKQETVRGKMLNAAKWSIGAEIFAKLITPFTSMILSRILAPEAFGIVATISIIISLADLLTDAGFSKYLVQHDFFSIGVFYEYANTAFWANCGMSCIIWVFIAVGSPLLADLVGARGYEMAIVAASLKLIITSITSVQRAVFQRELDYKTIFFVRMLVAFIPLVITIPLALIGCDYWSLIIATLVNEIVYAVVLTIKSSWKPELDFKFYRLKEMLSFSAWSLFEQLPIWLSTYADIFVISKYMSAYYLGLYKQPYQLITNIYGVITASIFAILFSALSRFNDDSDEIGYRATLINTQKMLAIIVIPMGFGIFLYREFITELLLGGQWKEASIVIGCFALEKIIQIIFNNSASEIYRSKGKPQISAVAQIIFLIILIPMCVLAVQKGFREFVITRALMCLPFLLIHETIIYRNFRINLFTIIPHIASIATATGIMIAAGYVLKCLVKNTFLLNMMNILICMIVYGATLLLFKDTRKIMMGVLDNVRRRMVRFKVK